MNSSGIDNEIELLWELVAWYLRKKPRRRITKTKAENGTSTNPDEPAYRLNTQNSWSTLLNASDENIDVSVP